MKKFLDEYTLVRNDRRVMVTLYLVTQILTSFGHFPNTLIGLLMIIILFLFIRSFFVKEPFNGKHQEDEAG